MGYRLNRPDEPVFMAVPKPMLTEFGIHYRLESCVVLSEARRPLLIRSPAGKADTKRRRQLMVWLDYDTNDNLSTNCVQFVLVLSCFCLKFVTTKQQQKLSFVKFCTKTRQK